MASKVEEEVDRADRLSRQLDRYEDGEPPTDQRTQEVSTGEANREATDRDTTVENFAMARIGRRMMWIAAALVIIMATHPGVRGFFLGLNPDAAPVDGMTLRPSKSEMDAVRDVRVLPIEAGAGRVQFEVLAKSTSSITLVESESYLRHSETNQTVALKDARCVRQNSNHLVCSADFDTIASKESYQLKVTVKNGNKRIARVYSEHLTLTGTQSIK